jgi:hypothetical protein
MCGLWFVIGFCSVKWSNGKCLGLARTVYYIYTVCDRIYIYTVCDRKFGDFPAKNTLHAPYIYMVPANPRNACAGVK